MCALLSIYMTTKCWEFIVFDEINWWTQERHTVSYLSYGRFSVSAKMGHYDCHCAPFRAIYNRELSIVYGID